jgi:uncharacterized phage protein (TIGR01671 family)
MRDFKFRAWDKISKKMRFNYIAKSGDEKGDWILFGADDKEGVFGGWNNPYPREMFELMQYTGLKDKDGREIYEGDILSYKSESKVVVVEETYEVRHGKYNNGLTYEDYIGGYGWYGHPIQMLINDELSDFFGINYLIPGDELSGGSVIGNIFENPELLKED